MCIRDSPYIDETNQENDPKVHNDKDIYSLVVADVDDAIANLSDEMCIRDRDTATSCTLPISTNP